MYNDVMPGDSVHIRLEWGKGKLITATVLSKEQLGHKGKDVVGYIDDNGQERWAYFNQIVRVLT